MIVNQFSSKKNRNNEKAKINFDIFTLDTFCVYILQSTVFVRMEHLVNLRKLIRSIDPAVYENDPEKVKRYQFLFKGLEARLDNKINDVKMVLMYINGGIDYKIDFLNYDKLVLSKDEITYCHRVIAESLQNDFLYEGGIDTLQDLCTRFKATDFANRGFIIRELEKEISSLNSQFRRSKVNDNSLDMTFSLEDGKFEAAVTDTWNIITNPSRRLRCGMQGLNELVGGGFESGRVYMLFGTSGVGKSVTLLNLMYQIKRYNPNYKPKDPTKIPCVVLLTMENTVVETITRLFDMTVEGSRGMGNYSVEDAVKLMKYQGGLYLNDSSPINLIIKYRANKSVDTSYLYSLYDDLLDEGYEMICLIQDHVKRIRSVFGNSDLRLELGDVVNEFKVFAAEKDIPVLTNSHLNRDGARVLEEAAAKPNSEKEIGKLLGKSNVGESMLIVDNLDCGMTITLDYDKDGNRYMTFNLIKMRDKPERTYIAQPFVPGSTIRLLEDVGGIPQFKESVHQAPELRHVGNVKVSSSSNFNNRNMDIIKDFEEEEDEFNSFKEKDVFTIENESTPEERSEIIEDMNTSFSDLMSSFKKDNTIEKHCPFIFDDNLILK